MYLHFNVLFTPFHGCHNKHKTSVKMNLLKSTQNLIIMSTKNMLYIYKKPQFKKKKRSKK